MNDMADDYEPPVDGLDLKLTIDSKIQTIMEREFDNAVATYQPDGLIGDCHESKDGRNSWRCQADQVLIQLDFRHVDPDIYNRNLPVWSSYEPGSTFKIITLQLHLKKVK